MEKDETQKTEAELENTASEEEHENTETESSTTEETSQSAPSDPLDAMDDAQMRAFALAKEWQVDESLEGDSLRAKLKERRSIAQRHASSQDQESDVVKKSDLESTREAELKESLSESEDPVEQDILKNWSDIAEFYSPRNGRQTAKAILKDMKIARAAYREANPPKEDESIAATQELSNLSGKGGTSPKPAPPQKQSLMPKRTKMDEWYKGDDD